MKNRIIVITLLLATTLLAGCEFYIPSGWTRPITGSGHVVTETREISGVNAVELDGLGDVTLVQGDKESLTVEAEDNLMPLIKTEVRGGTLKISYEREGWGTSIRPTRPVKYALYLREVKSLTVSGAANIYASEIKSDALTLNIDGAGNIHIDRIEASQITTIVDGAGNVDMAGNVVTQEARLNGLGRYETRDLNSRSARVTVSGAGGATLWARETLDIQIEGAGSVEYYGSPKVNRYVAGLGSIRGLGAK